MEENNRKGPGVFYAVVGVATLVVAIIGATFAYFSATASDNNVVRGTTAEANLTLTVEKLTEVSDGTASYGPMVPQKDAYINDAVTGTEDTEAPGTYNSCIDENGNVVCQEYKITIKNEGSAATKVSGTFKLEADTATTADSQMTNLKWAVKETQDGTYGAGNYAISTDNANGGDTSLTGSTVLATDVNLAATTGEKVYYVVVWISELEAAQEDYDHGSFKGTVSFNSASGGLTSTFNGNS